MKKTIFLSLLAIISIYGCKKETPPEVKSSKLKIPTQQSNISTIRLDSLTSLRNDFNLEEISTIPADIPKEEFKSIEEARAFLTNVTNGKFEQKTATSTLKITNNNMARWAGEGYFYLMLPHASIKVGNFRFDWPSGFILTGDIQGDGTYVNNDGRWGYDRMWCNGPKVESYGFTWLSSFESTNVSFRQIYSGASLVDIRFSGMLKIVVLVGDIGHIYSRPINSTVVAKLGPWPRGMGGDLSVDNAHNFVQSYISR